MMEVNLFIGAHAYACLSLPNGAKIDIRLDAGKSAPASLRDYAEDCREEARRKLERAELALQAADILESK